MGEKIENESNDGNGNAGDEEDLLELIESWDQVCDNEDALLMVNEGDNQKESKIYIGGTDVTIAKSRDT